MRRVLYGGGTFITGDAVAETLLDYARILAGTVRADTVHVPALVDGRPATVELLVGPASQLMTEPVADDVPLDDAAFLADIAERTRTTSPTIGPAGQHQPHVQSFFDDF